MKKRIIIALTVVFALGLAMAVYALNQTHVSHKTSADCCAKKDSCPMKKGDVTATADKASCCDKDDCCCKGGSCPMKMNGEKSEGKDCCCKDGSCPMKKNAEKETASVDMKNVTVAGDGENCCGSGASCCDGGSCCKGKQG